MFKFMLKTIAVGLVCAGSAQAASVSYNFNTDPAGILNLYGNAAWSPSGGVTGGASDGYLSVTDAANSQRSAIVFGDFDAGQVVAAFTFEADLRIGNGSSTPADGFSVNYCRVNDPVLTDVANSGDPALDGDIWAWGPQCENNLPEEGTRTGIAIGFDAWNSGGSAPYCNGLGVSDPSYIGPDIIGISVRVDALLIAQIPMPTLNGSVTDPTSIQTGPYDGANPGSPAGLGWAHLKVEVDTSAKLTVTWKGTVLVDHYQTTYFPSPGRLVFSGRTGGANQNQHVDNISITTVPASTALVGAANGFPDGFTIGIGDSGSSVVDTTTITTKLNGTTVTPTSITKVGGATTVNYHAFPTLLPLVAPTRSS
jgi:hypothetical protein